MASDFRILLLGYNFRVKRSEECMPRIRSDENRKMVEDFIEAGNCLTDQLKKLLRACEPQMREAAKIHARHIGIEFINSIFGRDRQLESTEKLIAAIWL